MNVFIYVFLLTLIYDFKMNLYEQLKIIYDCIEKYGENYYHKKLNKNKNKNCKIMLFF